MSFQVLKQANSCVLLFLLKTQPQIQTASAIIIYHLVFVHLNIYNFLNIHFVEYNLMFIKNQNIF